MENKKGDVAIMNRKERRRRERAERKAQNGVNRPQMRIVIPANATLEERDRLKKKLESMGLNPRYTEIPEEESHKVYDAENVIIPHRVSKVTPVDVFADGRESTRYAEFEVELEPVEVLKSNKY